MILSTSTSRPPVPLPWQYLTASSALKKGVRICIYALTANQSHPCQVWILREILKDVEVETAKARCSCINDWGEGIAWKVSSLCWKCKLGSDKACYCCNVRALPKTFSKTYHSVSSVESEGWKVKRPDAVASMTGVSSSPKKYHSISSVKSESKTTRWRKNGQM